MSPEEIPAEVLTKVLTKRPQRKKIKRYVTNWKPVHTHVVYLSLQGLDYDDIMAQTGMSRTAVTNILRTPEAEKIRNTVHAQVISRGLQSVPEKVASIQAVALENISNFIQDKNQEKKNPFSFFDRNIKALETVSAMQKRGQIPGDETPPNSNPAQTNIQTNIFVSSEQSKQLLAGLPKALQVAEAHAELLPSSVGNINSLKRDG